MNKVTVTTLLLSANLLQALPHRLCCQRCGSRFRSFQAEHTLQGTGKQYTSLTSGLRFAIILLPPALLKWFDCNICAIYGASRLFSNSATSSTLTHSSGMAREGGYTKHSARSLPSGFPTQMPYTRWTLFASRFFFLSFDFLRFSFFLRLLLICSLCMPALLYSVEIFLVFF